jgi:general secretion pathway protein I
LSARGFTLIEVLVALVVLAVAGFAVSARVGDVVNQTFSLERRTVAHWVAENHVNRMRLAAARSDEPIPVGRTRERVLMSGREWLLETEILDTPHPWLRRVEVRVSEVLDGREIGPLDQMTAFLGRY